MTFSARDEIIREEEERKQEFHEWLAERDAAIRTMDIEFARRMMPGASSDEVRLTAMHKARYEMTGMESELRHASRQWLEERGYKRLMDLPWPAAGELPE